MASDPIRAEDILALLSQQGQQGHVFIMRHALAPGFGDPEGFRLEDCASQRNLSEDGRVQARRTGARLRAAGITSARVYSSGWCRCLDTARELGLGPVERLPHLDSLFREERDVIETRTDALRSFLLGLEQGPPVVLVTHQANIRALTGLPIGSAEGIVLRLEKTGAVTVLGNLQP